MQTMRMLIKIVMLKELGFDEERVSKFVGRNKRIVELRGL